MSIRSVAPLLASAALLLSSAAALAQVPVQIPPPPPATGWRLAPMTPAPALDNSNPSRARGPGSEPNTGMARRSRPRTPASTR